ncbi:spore germination protein [Halobacillus locisalis]|uniref:Spore germination protein n=1 Tax=Halobacillus locisalis TaxID=220753 RepID=A0A838CWB2_9BACI|nr:spore germination protein [Halobacillus locisalis]MBA2175896.1 spore germination protein [Halobacillus locisalis]
MTKWLDKLKRKEPLNESEETLEDLLKTLKKSGDFITYSLGGHPPCTISYIKTLSKSDYINDFVIKPLKNAKLHSLKEMENAITVENIEMTDELSIIKEKIMIGYALIQSDADNKQVLLIPATSFESRQVGTAEVEFSVVGPKEAFVESLHLNINLVRKRLPLPQLRIEEQKIGKVTNTRVATIFIDGIANPDNVQTVKQRLQDIEYDQIIDSSFITQMLADNSSSPFPQLLDTERPDRAVSTLVEGKIVIIVDGSPQALICPTTVVEFFSASDDYFLPWHLATVFRLIRLFAVLFSVLSTPLYVAILTFHHEMIPRELMATIVSSRSDIPFPPILEVIILELAIELLREAGARLPTKIGQTIGIVGGIVIGTAAVDAGLTSNVLLIIVALSALASFTTPVYQIGNTIRLIRFPFIIGAQLWGLVGIAMVMIFFMGHLIKLKSIGSPFFEPLYPLRIQDLKDAFIRLPFNIQFKRPMLTRSPDQSRVNTKRVKEKRDIDE